jgi:hypothetical protein
MIIKMIMCKQVGMQENEHIKDYATRRFRLLSAKPEQALLCTRWHEMYIA